MVVERRPAGATHSFRLTPGAYSVIEGVPKKSKQSRGRSAWVSEAIQWYASSTSVAVSQQLGNLIFPNMELASPEELHGLCKELQQRVTFWVERSNGFENELKEWKKQHKSWLKWVIGKIKRKKTPK